MTCHNITPTLTMCCPNIYKFPFEGTDYYFEWHYWCGPIPLKKKNLEPRKTTPKGSFKAIKEWQKLPGKERKQYLIYS